DGAKRLPINASELRRVKPEAITDNQAETPERNPSRPRHGRPHDAVPEHDSGGTQEGTWKTDRVDRFPDCPSNLARELANGQRFIARNAVDLTLSARAGCELDHQVNDVIDVNDTRPPWPVNPAGQRALVDPSHHLVEEPAGLLTRTVHRRQSQHRPAVSVDGGPVPQDMFAP